MLRKRVETVVVAAPPSVLDRWRAELQERFGLVFEMLTAPPPMGHALCGQGRAMGAGRTVLGNTARRSLTAGDILDGGVGCQT